MLGSCNFITLKLFHQKTACPPEFSELLSCHFAKYSAKAKKMSQKLILKCTKEKLTKARPNK